MIDPEDRDELITSPRPGDDAPVQLTKFQVQKIACILDAALTGHELWREHAIAAVDLLHTAGIEAGMPPDVVRPSAADRWVRDLASLPWPPSGPPSPQPE